MESSTSVETRRTCNAPKKTKLNLKNIRSSLKYRPEILKLLIVMRKTNIKKTAMLKKIKHKLVLLKKKFHDQKTSAENKQEIGTSTESQTDIVAQELQRTTENNSAIHTTETDVMGIKTTKASFKTSHTQTTISVKNMSTQTDDLEANKVAPKISQNNDTDLSEDKKNLAKEEVETKQDTVAWDISGGGDIGKSIADQVKEVAQSAMQQTGMIYVETAGMYYDYKTGYYYNPESGLYYHTDTGCYYHYSEDKQFVFHSYPDRSTMAATSSLLAHEKRKAKRNKKVAKTEEDIDKLTRNLSQEEDQGSKPKRKKKTDKKKQPENTSESKNETSDPKMDTDVETMDVDKVSEKNDQDNELEKVKKEEDVNKEDLEDGECSVTGSETELSDGEESEASTVSADDDDAVAKHHPPCMRIIVRETKLPKLKVGSLFLVTKDGGTIGREGDQHTILLKDHNVSRNHLDIRYDIPRRIYLATDLGSKNGTLLNGIQMSESQLASQPMEVIHGSIIQLGETKLLCHIHPGNDTCGHCEPGLIIETTEKEKVAYTRNCSVKKQYELELARLKNKYAPQPLMIEEGTYNDRAKSRREAVGSSHHSEKTQSADIETSIAPENKGFKMLEKMGWSKGEGLGKESQGETEPVPLVSNEGTAGLGTGAVGAPKPPPPKPRNKLGTATLRLAARSKLLQPPAKAFQNPLDDEDDE